MDTIKIQGGMMTELELIQKEIESLRKLIDALHDIVLTQGKQIDILAKIIKIK